jgi:RHS repeat-associated protein
VEPPRLTLPGGGATVRGMSESLEPVTLRGTCGLRVPVPVVTSGRGALPDLALVYSSAAGNSPFGLGWDVPLPSVARKTERGLPRYTDDDRFVLTGADDLVAVGPLSGPAPLGGSGEQTWCQRYRPRTEGGFARIERHRSVATGATFWVTISPGNVATIFGRSEAARISDPEDPGRVFSWLVEESFDDRGNHVHYHWVPDDGRGVDAGAAEEVHRSRYAQRYLREVAYLAASPVPDRWAYAPIDHSDPDWRRAFHALAVFDYGDLTDLSTMDISGSWDWRADRFSSYRPGFELRTQRRCRRVVAYSSLPDVGSPWRPVAAVELGYDNDAASAKLISMTAVGFDDSATPSTLPPLTLGYRPWTPSRALHSLAPDAAGAPTGLLRPYQWIDLDADGASGLLHTDGSDWLYKANLGGASFAPPRVVASAPAGEASLAAVFGDGRLAATTRDGTTVRYAVRDPQTLDWNGWRAFPATPVLDWSDPRLRQVDLDGDGVSDVLRHEADALVWHRFGGEDGWEAARHAPTGLDEWQGPRIALDDPAAAVLFADLTGDGLEDLVRVTAASVCYWPNLGYGRFGAMVTMGTPPQLDQFEPARVRLSDVDGTGPADLVYLGADGVTYWPNQAGNSWGAAFTLAPVVVPTALSTVDLVDLLGRGTRCLVLSDSDAPTPESGLRYVDLMPDGRPGLLTTVDNGRGLRTDVEYASSTEFALRDRRAGNPWSTHLPIPVQVVSAVSMTDQTTGVSTTTSYRYRDGYYDLADREFRGFGRVEQADADTFRAFLAGPPGHWLEQRDGLPPQVAVTWYHTGAVTQQLPERAVADVWESGVDERRHEALRALRGRVLRQATYALDGTGAAGYPYAVTEHSYLVRVLDPAPDDPDGFAVVAALPGQSIESHIERNPVALDLCYPDPDYLASLPPYTGTPEPPRRSHTFAVSVNDLGQVERSLTVAYGRSAAPPRPHLVTSAEAAFGNLTSDPAHYRLGVALREAAYEVLAAPAGDYDLATAASLAAAAVVPDDGMVPAQPARRKLSVVRHRYWDDAADQELPDGAFGVRGEMRRSLAAAATDRQVGLLVPEITPAEYDTAGGHLLLSDVDGEELHWAPGPVVQPDPARFHQPVAFVDPFGRATFVSYDAASLLPAEALVTRAVAAGGDRYAPDPAGPTWHRTRATYDYRVLAPATVTDPHGVVREAEYDPFGQPLRQRTRGPAGEGAPTGEWDHEYSYHPWSWVNDATPVWADQRSRETFAANSSWRRAVTYLNGSGRALLSKVEAEPGPAPYYGNDGHLVLDQNGQPLLRDTTPVRWLGNGRTVYDGKARPIAVYDPYFAPDERYEDEAVLVATGHPVFLRYDPVGRPMRTDFPDGTFDRVEFGPWQSVMWDRADTVLDSAWYQAATDPSASSDAKLAASASATHAATPATLRLDAAGRTVEVVEQLGAVALVSTVDFDAAGRPVRVTDPRGVVASQVSFDLLGRPVVSIGADSGEARLFADALGRPVRTFAGCTQWTSVSATVEVRTLVERDLFGRDRAVWVREADEQKPVCRRAIGYGDDDPGYSAPRYLLGTAHQSFDGAGLAETLAHDFTGNPTSTRRRFLARYDQQPDWSAVATAVPTADRSPLVAAALEAAGATEVIAYDALRRPVRRTHTDGSVVDLAYGAGGLVASIQATPSGGNARTVVDSARYDVRRRTEQVAYGPGGATAQTAYAYDDLTHRVMRISTVARNQSLQDLRFVYDAVGNVLVTRDLAQSTAYFRNSVVGADREYTYDDLYRLTGATGRELAGTAYPTADASRRPPVRDLPDPNDLAAVVRYEESYDYDSGGNLTRLRHAQKVNGGATWVRDLTPAAGSNRLAATAVSGDVVSSDALAHDARGQLTQLGYLSFDWSWQNQPATAVVGGNVTAYYHYDAAGNRVRKVVVSGANVAERRYLGGCELDTVSVNGAAREATRTLRVPSGDRIVALLEQSTMEDGQPVQRAWVSRYQLGDQLDSTTVELDDAGSPLTYEEFHPYGTSAYFASRASAGVSLKRYRFSAKERDEETGLNYHGARYYAPWLGRWLSPDPSGLVDGTNLYAYTRGNPVCRHDPGGRQTKPVDQPVAQNNLPDIITIESDIKKVNAAGKLETVMHTSEQVLTKPAPRGTITIESDVKKVDKQGQLQTILHTREIILPPAGQQKSQQTPADTTSTAPPPPTEVTGGFGFLGVAPEGKLVSGEALGIGGYDTHLGPYAGTLVGGGHAYDPKFGFYNPLYGVHKQGAVRGTEKVYLFRTGQTETEHLNMAEMEGPELGKAKVQPGAGAFFNAEDPRDFGFFGFVTIGPVTAGGGVTLHVQKDFETEMRETMAKEGVTLVRAPEGTPKLESPYSLRAKLNSWLRLVGIDAAWEQRQIDAQNQRFQQEGMNIRLVGPGK